MRIGIITFHHAFNYGAFLQSAGLHGCLKELGHEPEIIDYRNPKLEAVHERCIRYGWHPLRRWAGYQRRSRFIECLAKLTCSPLSRSSSDIKWSNYDAVIYGSDEIWNFISHTHRYDPVFFGHCCPNSIARIAYAPSLGELDSAREIPPEISLALAAFYKIGVRDINTATFVEAASGIIPPIVTDPVFLHDFHGDLPDAFLAANEVLMYGQITDPGFIAGWKDYAKRHKLKAVSVGYYNSWCDRHVLQASPYEFVALLKSSRLVMTSTFHGTMFSIKYGIPFITYRTGGAKRKFDPLIASLGLESRIIDASPLNWELFAEPLPEKSLDILNRQVAESLAYLDGALRGHGRNGSQPQHENYPIEV